MPEQKYLASLIGFVDVLERIGPYAIALVVISYTLYRTRSAFFLLYRIQMLIGGSPAFHNERIQKHWNSYEDLHRVNFWFGLRLNSSHSLYRLYAWMDRNDFAVEEIARSVPYFDTNRLRFFFPATWELRLRGVFVWIGASAALIVAVVFLFPDHALLYVKKTGTLFWAESGDAHSTGNSILSLISDQHSWQIDSEYCLFTDTPSSLLDTWDQHVICDLVLGNRDEYIAGAVTAQRFLGTYLLLIFLVIVFPAWRLSYKRKHARLAAAQLEAIETTRLQKQNATGTPATAVALCKNAATMS